MKHEPMPETFTMDVLKILHELAGVAEKRLHDLLERQTPRPLSAQPVEMAAWRPSAAGNRRGPVAELERRELILDRWAAGVDVAEIAKEVGLRPKAVHSAVARARNAPVPDPRAMKRNGGTPRSTDLEEAILNLYSDPAKHVEIPAIASQLGTSRTTVNSTLTKFRKLGDPRAEKRGQPARSRTPPAAFSRLATSRAEPRQAGDHVAAGGVIAARSSETSTSDKQTRNEPGSEAGVSAGGGGGVKAPTPPTEKVPLGSTFTTPSGHLVGFDQSLTTMVGDGGATLPITRPMAKVFRKLADGGLYPLKILSAIGDFRDEELRTYLNSWNARLGKLGVGLHWSGRDLVRLGKPE